MKTFELYIKIFALGLLLSAVYPRTATSQQASSPDPANTSLAEFIDQNQNPSQNTDNSTPSEEKEDNKGSPSWIRNMAGKLAEKGSQVFTGDEKRVEVIKRSNASVFDISGIMLRMDREQVAEAMQKRGYKKTAEHMEIPNFIRWRYEEQCRNQGIIGYERIANCVVLLSQKNNYQYVQKENFNNFLTKESIEIYYTSNFTGNKVYRVMYQTEAANIKGSGAKAEYLRNIKVFDFWKKINQKYGNPDNREEVTWGLGDKKPVLKAATGRLILEDPMLLELDYTRMSREDQKFMNTAIYTF